MVNPTDNIFLDGIHNYATQAQTGCLKIQNILNQQETPWLLYFRLGRLFWTSGGKNEGRRVSRHLRKHFPKETPELWKFTSEINWEFDSAYYNFLSQLLKAEQIDIQLFVTIKQEIILEVLFDLLQIHHLQKQEGSEYSKNSGLYWEWYDNVRPTNYVPLPQQFAKPTKELIEKAQADWENWQETGLKNCFPNQAPKMTQPEKIKEVTAEKTFKNLERLLTGKQSLRDIAATTKRDIIPVTKVLWGYYKKGWLEFQTLSDINWPPNKHSQPSQPTSPPQSREAKFLVACVDDSPQVTQTLEVILQKKCYDFIGINDPLRANVTLLKAKPNLIFLDLIMPNTNGYEICSQLRKVSTLQEIPIIILTGKDGLIDRMRAKMVGANEYMSKPVQEKMILAVVQKYLPSLEENQSETNFHGRLEQG